MERMREHVFNEADLNHDGLIRYTFQRIIRNPIQYYLCSSVYKVARMKGTCYQHFIFIAVTKNFWSKRKNLTSKETKDGKDWTSSRFTLNKSTKLTRDVGKRKYRR